MGKYLKTKYGNNIYYKEDKVQKAKATILINHGFAEHLDRYDYLVKALNHNGYNVYRYDLRGHGRSGIRKGYIDNYRDFLADCQAMMDLIKFNDEDKVFMFGHSMGGLITFLYGLENKDLLQGQIFSGAAVGQLPSASGIKSTLFKLANVFLKDTMIKNPVSNDICSDPQVVDAYLEDPLVLEEASLNFYVEFLVNGTRHAIKHMEEYNYPCLILQGQEDKIVPKEISENLYEKIQSKDKEIKVYKDLYHEILNEKSKDIVISDIIHWLDKRV